MSASANRLFCALSRVCAWTVVAGPFSVGLILVGATVHSFSRGSFSLGAPTWLACAFSSLLLAVAGTAIGTAACVPVVLNGGADPWARWLSRCAAGFLRCVPAVVLGALGAWLMTARSIRPTGIALEACAILVLGIIAIPIVVNGFYAHPHRSEGLLFEAAAALGASRAQTASVALLPGLWGRVRPGLAMAFVRLLPEATAVQIVLGAPLGSHKALLAMPLGARILTDAAARTDLTGLAPTALLLLAATTLAAYLVGRPRAVTRWA